MSRHSRGRTRPRQLPPGLRREQLGPVIRMEGEVGVPRSGTTVAAAVAAPLPGHGGGRAEKPRRKLDEEGPQRR